MDSLDVSPNTHVLALLGSRIPIHLLATDGLYHSRFLSSQNRLLAGLGKKQTWLMPPDLDSTVEDCGPVLHGNPFRPRQVVYDSTRVRTT